MAHPSASRIDIIQTARFTISCRRPKRLAAIGLCRKISCSGLIRTLLCWSLQTATRPAHTPVFFPISAKRVRSPTVNSTSIAASSRQATLSFVRKVKKRDSLSPFPCCWKRICPTTKWLTTESGRPFTAAIRKAMVPLLQQSALPKRGAEPFSRRRCTRPATSVGPNGVLHTIRTPEGWRDC